MISGARIGQPTWLRRLVARAESHALTAFVVPGAAIARVHGLDLAAAGLSIAPSPRHANVLVVVGKLPEGLVQPTAVAYAQIARPRAILRIGGERVASLPAPDVTVALDQAALIVGIAALRRRYAAGAWTADADAFALDIAEQQPTMDHGDHDHHMMHNGMEMTGHEGASGESQDRPIDHAMHHHTSGETTPDAPMAHDDHGGDHAANTAHPTDDPHISMRHEMHGGMAMEQSGHNQAMAADPHHGMAMEHDATGHDAHDGMDMPMDHNSHGGMDMEMEMDMSGGFMSMIAMTRDLPRSRDGLPMEWADAPFGPLFPGLPGGLALTLTLDGDTVAQAKVVPGAVHRGLGATWPGPAAAFPDRLASLDPFSPMAYRVLASRALEDAAAFTIEEGVARQRVGALERERATNHLSWLADFATLLGDRWLAGRAEELQFALMRAADNASLRDVQAAIIAFVRRVERTPLLKGRLDGIGYDASHATEKIGGPFARASSLPVDARLDEPTYRDLGFAPVLHDGNDAWARLQVHLGELTQSMGLIRAAGSTILPDPFALTIGSRTGKATVETPRGPATLHVTLRDEEVTEVHLDTPSGRLIHLVPGMAEGRELADALVGIASLDLSPWEVDR